MPVIAYLAHPVGGTNGREMVEQAENVYNGGRWWKFLTLHTQWAVMIPWSPHYIYGDNRVRAINDQIEILDACGVLILTGEYVAGYMEILRERAYLQRKPILNLLDLGDDVPEWMTELEARGMLRNRAAIIGVRIEQGPKEIVHDRRKYDTDLGKPRDPVEKP